MSFPENRKQEYSIPLSHALHKVIQDAKENLSGREVELYSSMWRKNKNNTLSAENCVETVLEQEALHILQHRLTVMANEIAADDRASIHGARQTDSTTLFELATVDGNTLYTDTDVLQCTDGTHKIFLYPSKFFPPRLSSKIPAILLVGDYGHFECFDNAKYVIWVYPGCFLTSIRGVSWRVNATANGKLFELIQQSNESALPIASSDPPRSPRERD